MNWLASWGDAATTAVGFFWKAGWAFVLGYAVSGMIQAFVPKARLTRRMGDAGVRSVTLATLFGAASSSCSFAALAAARSLVLKGAHFVAAVAFMFASTNLVIELGVLILIFLGWQYLAAEIVGGLLLIGVTTVLIRLTYPRSWMDAARERVERGEEEEEDFDWRKRIRSREGWRLAGHKFAKDWKMAWEEILIGFTVAGFAAVLVPDWVWARVFLRDSAADLPAWVVAAANAAVAPFVAAATFIGSMGNIPLATVLDANGVMFAGIMGFIYSDLMVPPLVAINAKYYGKRVALYIAAVMFVGIVITALALHAAFAAAGILPEGRPRAVEEIGRFAVDYTLFLNLAMAAVAVFMVRLHRGHVRAHRVKSGGHHGHGKHEEGGSGSVKRAFTVAALVVLGGGIAAWGVSAILAN